MVCGPTKMRGEANLSKLKLLTMSDIPAEEVRWLWYPYLPRGKITIIQGDAGEGKTTFVLALASLLTRGLPAPGNTESQPPMNIIYQTAEDGLAGEIRRLLEQAGKKRERRFSLPKIRLPRPSLEWLLVPAVLLGLLALWYGWATLWNGLTALFP